MPTGSGQTYTCCLGQIGDRVVGCRTCNQCGFGLVSTVAGVDDCCTGNSAKKAGDNTVSCTVDYKYCCKRLITGPTPANKFKCFDDIDIPSGDDAESYCDSLK